MFDEYAARWGQEAASRADGRFVSFVETKLAGAVGGASARVLVSSVSKEESLTTDDVLSMLEEASQLRAYSRALGQVALAGRGHGTPARGQRAAQEPGRAEGRVHVVRHARAGARRSPRFAPWPS